MKRNNEFIRLMELQLLDTVFPLVVGLVSSVEILSLDNELTHPKVNVSGTLPKAVLLQFTQLQYHYSRIRVLKN